MMNNPLLNKSDFAAYAEIGAEHIIPAVETVIAKAKTQLEEILKPKELLTFDNVHRAFIELEEGVEKVWTPVENMLSLVGAKDIRDAAEEARNILVEFYNDYSLDERVYKLIKAYDASPDALKLKGEYLRYHQDTLKDLRLSGAELEGADKEEFKQLNMDLAQLTQKFSDNVTDSKFELLIESSADLSGLPGDIIEGAQHAAAEKKLKGWLFTLDYPSYGR
jgi:oligopeptidase A